MHTPILDDLELYSDLVSSVGEGGSDRVLTPIECSELIIRLQKETNENDQQLSKRLGLGKKRKIKTLDDPLDTTQLNLFKKLQGLSKMNAHMLGFRNQTGKIPFTTGCMVAELDDKNDHNWILKTVLASYDTKKPLTTKDVFEIVSRKKKSLDVHISEIIETVVNLKPVVDEYYLIIIKINENLKLFIKKSNQSIKEILEKKLEIKIFSSF